MEVDSFVVEQLVCELNSSRCTFSLLKNQKVICLIKQDDEEFYVAVDSWLKAQQLFQRQVQLGWRKI